MYNWSLSVDHIYCCHSNCNAIENSNELLYNNIICSDIFSYQYYKIKKTYSTCTDFKNLAVYESICDAYKNGYKRIFIFRDDMKFDIASDKAIKLINDSIKFDYYILNAGDICEDAIILSDKAISFICEKYPNITVPNWYETIIQDLINDAQIKKASCNVCSHKIDFVLPYVNSDDTQWNHDIAKYKDDQCNHYRYRDYGTLEYQIKEIFKYCRYVNNIYVIVSTKTQISGNFPDYPNVNIVTHDEFIPGKYLPTFNSQTIEMFLWNIPELTEYFVYTNDDIFIFNTLGKEQLFENGKVKINFIRQHKFDDEFQRVCRNSHILVDNEFGNKHKVMRPMHSIMPLRRSSCMHVYNVNRKYINSSITPIRCDDNVNQYIYSLYENFSGNTCISDIHFMYYDISKIQWTDINQYDVVCINDNNIVNVEPMLRQLREYVCDNLGENYILGTGNPAQMTQCNIQQIIHEQKLSVIVPVYNAEKYLERCIMSILAQTYTNLELILVNDGSTDDSGNICEKYVQKDQRVIYVSRSNRGVAAARNFGLDMSSGYWIGFVDSDDWIEEDRFEKAIYYANAYEVSIVQCSIKVYKNDKFSGKVWGLTNDQPELFCISDDRIFSNTKYDMGHCWDKIYKAECIKKVRFFNCNLFEDTLFNICAYAKSRKLLGISLPLYNYSVIDGSLAHKGDISNEERMLLYTEIKKCMESVVIPKKVRQTFVSFLNLCIYNRTKNTVDYVFPYVNSDDPEWKTKYSVYFTQQQDNIETESVADERFRNDNLLKYKFRAIEKWMPWVGIIHLIVSDISQVPEWVDQTKVHVVLHSDYIPEKHLPTFNSCTIEMYLHNIFGLAEHFIYSNDDTYPNYKLVPSHFYRSGRVKADIFNRKLWHKEDYQKAWCQIPLNSLKLAAKDVTEYYNKYIDGEHMYELQHISIPMLKSNNIEVYEKYADEIEASISMFRESFNINQYVFTEYALFHGRGYFETFRFKYGFIGNNTNDLVNAITNTDYETRFREICCNDSMKATVKDFNKIETAFITIYKNKCIYEL